jgi:hypothetical protein
LLQTSKKSQIRKYKEKNRMTTTMIRRRIIPKTRLRTMTVKTIQQQKQQKMMRIRSILTEQKKNKLLLPHKEGIVQNKKTQCHFFLL